MAGEAPAPGFTIAPSKTVQDYLNIVALMHTPDPEALSALAVRLKAPLPKEPRVRLLSEKNFTDSMDLSHGRKVYDPDSPDLYVGLPERYMAIDKAVLLQGTALALLYRKQGQQRRLFGRIGFSMVGGGVTVSFVGGAFDFQGHGWGGVVEKVGFGTFFAGGALVAYAYGGSPKVPDLSGLAPPIRVSPEI